MKKLILLLLISVSLFSCTAESIAQEELIKPPIHVNKENTFTVKWESNQEEPFVVFNKHTFISCDEHTTRTETHYEHKFDVTLLDNQRFDIHINRGSTVKNPELYLAIYKGDELQFEQEVNTNGYVLATYVNHDGNIGQVPTTY